MHLKMFRGLLNVDWGLSQTLNNGAFLGKKNTRALYPFVSKYTKERKDIVYFRSADLNKIILTD